MGSKVSSQSSNAKSQQQSTSTSTATATATSSGSTTTSSSSSSTTSSAYTGLANIIKLLPTGTVFLFQFLNPLLTNNGQCHTYNKYLSAILIAVCGLSCCIASFTDSYKGSDGSTHYGVATAKGIWPSSSSGSSSSGGSLSGYKLRFSDFVHAFLSVIIFAVLALLDTNTVRCFYPSFETTEKTLIMVLPTVIGSISSTVFTLFPSTRNGVGYPSSDASTTSGASTTSESNAEKV